MPARHVSKQAKHVLLMMTSILLPLPFLKPMPWYHHACLLVFYPSTDKRRDRPHLFILRSRQDVAGKKCGLITCCEEHDPTAVDGVRIPIERSAALLNWDIVGEVLVPGVLESGDIDKTDGCKQSEELAHKF